MLNVVCDGWLHDEPSVSAVGLVPPASFSVSVPMLPAVIERPPSVCVAPPTGPTTLKRPAPRVSVAVELTEPLARFRKSAPPFATKPLVLESAALILSTPALTVVGPVKLLAPLRFQVPAPDLTRLPVAMLLEMLPVPAPASVSASGAPVIVVVVTLNVLPASTEMVDAEPRVMVPE